MEQYEVIFLDEDKKTILDRQFVNSGESVKYKGKMPSKEPINQVKYMFDGWIGEEKLECVNENLTLIAKYIAETNLKESEALINASLENAKNANIHSVMEAGQKIANAQKALENDTRTPEEIVNEILQNGKAEIGAEVNKENIER